MRLQDATVSSNASSKCSVTQNVGEDPCSAVSVHEKGMMASRSLFARLDSCQRGGV